METTIVETEDVETTEESEEVTIESQEYDFDASAIEEYEIYYQYIVKALDYNAVIADGESVTIGYTAEGNNHDIWDEKAEITLKEAEKTTSIPIGGTYEYDNYTVEVRIPAYWDGAYNVQLLITNTSDEMIHNWAFVMETTDTISGLYNAVEVSGNDNEKDSVHLIKNVGFDQDIPVGGTVEVGYTAYYEDNVAVPDDFALSQIETEVTTAECEVSLFISNEWENGGLAQIVIKNISELPIEDWMIEFNSVLDIKEIWGGVIESHEGEHYFIRNSGYAQNILPGESWTVGILFNGEAADIENVQVRQIVVDGNATPRVAKEDPAPYIRYMDTTPSENTEDIGEVYFKEITCEEDLFLNIENACCVRDQLLLVMKDGVAKSDVEDLAGQYDFRIVGAIALTGYYQIESLYKLTVEELQNVYEEISQSDLVDHVAYNYVSVISDNNWGSDDSFNTTLVISDGKNDHTYRYKCGNGDWGDNWGNSINPSGNNWGIEAINFGDALMNAGILNSSGSVNLKKYGELSPVRIGLIEEEFDPAHEDLNYVMTWNHSGRKTAEHGTHVSGIMAAEFNNGVGICGTSIKSDLYGVAAGGSSIVKDRSQLFMDECGLALLIGNNVKVINYSRGLMMDSFNILQGVKEVENKFIKRSKEIEGLLDDLLNKGYDFLIVTSAGNNNDGGQANHLTWDLLGSTMDDYVYGVAADPQHGISMKDAQAEYNSELNYISTKKVRDHILCVGALYYKNDKAGFPIYKMSPYSDRGSRVDILAPGGKGDAAGIDSSGNFVTDQIWSCTPYDNYKPKFGSSMAAPYVAGIAGLAFSIDPNLDAADLKNMIIDNSTPNVVDAPYPMLDAAKIIDAVVNHLGVDTEKTPEQQYGFVVGTITYDTGIVDSYGNPDYDPAECAEVQVYANNSLETIVYAGVDGTYEVTLEPGTYRFYYVADGYTTLISDEITLSGESVYVKDVVLQKAENLQPASIVFTITDKNGLPFSYCEAFIYIRKDDYRVTYIANASWNGWTDANGRCVIDGDLIDGKYVVAVSYSHKYLVTEVILDKSSAEVLNDGYVVDSYYHVPVTIDP